MKKEKYLIGAYYTNTDGQIFRFFVEGDYFEAYAKELAVNLRWIKRDSDDQEKARFLAALLGYLLDDAGDSARLLPIAIPVDHTIHIVNVDRGTVELWESDASELKVSFPFDKFIERYYK